MSSPGNTESGLSLQVRKRLTHTCRWSGCHEPAKQAPDRAAYCARHHEAVKAKARKWQAKQRARLRKARLCIDCTKPSGKRSRCKACREEHNEASVEYRNAKRVDRDTRGVDSTQPRTKLEVQSDGYTRVRTTGRGTKAVTRENKDDNLRTELGWAIAELQWVRDEGIATLRSERIAQLGRIQRQEATAIVADRAFQAARLARGVAQQLAPKRVAELEREIRETQAVDVDEE